MTKPRIERIKNEAHNGAVLAQCVWIKLGRGDPTLEAELYRLLSRFRTIEEEAEKLEAERK